MNQVKLLKSIKIAVFLLLCLSSFKHASAQNAIDVKEIIASGKPGISISLHRDDKMDKTHKQFFIKSPTVLLLHWKNDKQLEIYFQKEKVENYDLSNVADVKKAEKIYGKLPLPVEGSHSL